MFKKRSPVMVNPPVRHSFEQVTLLNGMWGTRMDEEEIGMSEKWYEFCDAVWAESSVPGSFQKESIGPSVGTYNGEVSASFRTCKSGFLGTVWYNTSFETTAAAEGEQIWLNFGGVSPTAEVWVNGIYVGDNHNPFISFGFDITELVKDGRNDVCVRMSEQDRLFALGHNCLGSWSGIYRGVELKRTYGASISEFRIVPDRKTGNAAITFISDGAEAAAKLCLTVKEYKSGAVVAEAAYDVTIGKEEQLTVSVDAPHLWSPDDPFLYCIEAVLKVGDKVYDACTDRFGFVEMTTKGKQFIINDDPYFLMGTGEFCEHPITVAPDTDIDNWRRKLKALRDYGYNYVRCQSYMAVQEYITAADEVGLLVQNELGALGAIGAHCPEHIYAWPQPNAGNFKHLLEQWTLGVKMAMNHPSARMWAMSNELAANGETTEYPRMAWKAYRETKKLDPGSLVIWTDGGINNDMPSDYINVNVRGFDLGDPDLCELNDKPCIQHEFQWWTSFIDVRLVEKYRESGHIPNWIERTCKNALANGLGDLLIDFAIVSQNIQAIEAKGKLEYTRRISPQIAGMDHFNATDTLGGAQGVLNEFYEKKLVDGEYWKQATGNCVILSDLDFDQRCLTFGKEFRCEIGVSDFEHPAFTCGKVNWKIADKNTVYASGELNYEPVPGRYIKAGDICVTLPQGDTPVCAALEVEMTENGRTVTNSWEVYLFPDSKVAMDDVAVASRGLAPWLDTLELKAYDAADNNAVVITDLLTDELISYAKKGGKVLVAASEGLVRAFHPQGVLSPAPYKKYRYYFTKPASYPPYEEGQYGTLLTKSSPLFGNFPIPEDAIHAGLQFFNLIGACAPLDAAPLGLDKKGVAMRMIHTWQCCRSLAELAWYSCGEGSIAISSIDFDQSRVEARSLLGNILDAMKNAPAPEAVISEETLKNICDAAILLD